MSHWVYHPEITSTAATYISKLELMPSHQKILCPSASVSAAQNKAFLTVSTPAGTEKLLPVSAGQSSEDRNLGNATTCPADVSSRAHLSRLDITLVHANRGKTRRKDHQCMCPSTAAAFHVPWKYSSSCGNPQNCKACAKQRSSVSSLDSGFTVAAHEKQHPSEAHNTGCSADASSKGQSPCWTSRLDVALASGRSVSPPQTSNVCAAFTSGGSDSTHQEHSQVSNLQAAVKLYISTCSIAVKPFREESQENNHAYSVLLVPQLGKASNTSNNFSVRSQAPKDGFPPTDVPTLQVTQLQVTSSAACPDPPYQTSTRHIWPSPAVLKREGSPKIHEFSTNGSDLEFVIFPQHHSTGAESRKTLSSELMANDHKGSKITLILATPLAAVPIQAIKECELSQTGPVFTNTCCCLNTGDPSLTVDIGAGFPLSISPVCCRKLPSACQHLLPPSSSSSWVTHSGRNRHPEELYRTIPASSVKSPLGDGMATPAISVSIGAFRAGRRVVKISVSTSQKHQEVGNTFSDGYRNIILGY